MIKPKGMLDPDYFEKGGPGSGNFGHEGRPGHVGGSGEGGASTDDKPSSRISSKFYDERDKVFGAKSVDEKLSAIKNAASKINMAIIEDLQGAKPSVRESFRNQALKIRQEAGYAEGFAGRDSEDHKREIVNDLMDRMEKLMSNIEAEAKK